jgi:soluble lytic murein transglycosylase-like protein
VASHTGEDVLFLKVLLLKSSIDVELARAIALETHRQAQLLRRDPDLVLAIMSVESDFEPQATSAVGAVGLMQVVPHWKRVLGISGDLAHISTNLHSGLQVLAFYLEMHGDLAMALTAYNRGRARWSSRGARDKMPATATPPRCWACTSGSSR